MKEERIIKVSKFLKQIRIGELSKIFLCKNNIRIAVIHHIKTTDTENFNLIIKYLTTVRKIITPELFFQYYISNPISSFKEKMLLITFDDGLYSSYRAAKTILSKYNIKAIFFIPTEIFELKSKDAMRFFAYKNIYHKEFPLESFTEDEFVTMDKNNILELRNLGHWILPHTHSHCNMSDIISEELVNNELIKPKLMLEDLLKEKINAFAFPEGSERAVNGFAYKHIKLIYKFCFTSLIGANHSKTEHYYFHRDCIHAHYPLSHVKNIIDGVFDPYYAIKMWIMKSKTKKNNVAIHNSYKR